MEIKDSGSRREFETGAVRDIAEGKGRCDLLPLDAVAQLTGDLILGAINTYVRTGNKLCLIEAVKRFSLHRYGSIYTAVLEASKQFQDGAEKYEERNWERGIPLHCFIDSGVRHYLKHRRGDTDEPHDRAFLFNMLGAVWTHDNLPDMIDLPFAQKGDREYVYREN